MTPPTRQTRLAATGRLLLLGLLMLLSFSQAALAKPNELLLGIEPEHNIFTQMANYRKMAGYLTGKVGIPVRLTVMSRYGQVLQRFKSLHLDGALLNSYTATLAIDALGMVPIVRPVNLAGEAQSQGVIFTRHDSGITKIGDMRGKSFAFVDQATTEGYLFPLTYLKKNGIAKPSSYLGPTFFTGSHASTISAVLDGRADLGAAKKESFSQLIARDPYISNELVIIAHSAPLPPTTLFLKSDLAPELKEKLTAALLGMAENGEGREILRNIRAQRFIRATGNEYDLVRAMAHEAGLNREHSATE